MWQPPPPRHSLAAETVFLRNLLSFKTLELQFFWSKVLRNNSLFAWEMGRGGDTVCWRVGSGVLYNQVWMRWRWWTMLHQMLGNIGYTTSWHILNIYGVERNMQILNTSKHSGFGQFGKILSLYSLYVSATVFYFPFIFYTNNKIISV